jgi:hypothetical protein
MMRRPLLVSVAALAAVFAVLVVGCNGDSSRRPGSAGVSIDGDFTYDYMIPPGSGAAADRGEHLDIFPDRLDAQVGESLRIINNDDRTHVLGPYTVGAGQVLTQEFTSPGTFVGVCSTNPGVEFVLSISG